MTAKCVWLVLAAVTFLICFYGGTLVMSIISRWIRRCSRSDIVAMEKERWLSGLERRSRCFARS